jgi:UDP-MurNAc hydroxylase
MEIKYISNASIFLKGKNSSILFDPWITFNNNSNSNYYNFPENKYSKKEIANLKPDYIYISHSHPDHFDEMTLNLFNKKTPVIVANFKNQYLKRNLNQIGFKNILVSQNNFIKMNKDDFCYLEPAETTDELDSISFFQIDNYKILNLNDNVSNFNQSKMISKKFNGIDLAFLPYCGFGAYPMSYDNLSKKQKQLAHKKKVNAAHKNFVKYIKEINPNYVIPFAGEVLMGGPKTSSYRFEGSGIGKKKDCVNYAKKKVKFNHVLMSQKCTFDYKTKKFKGKFQDNNFAKFKKYLNLISKKPSKFEKNGGFYISRYHHKDLSKTMEKALDNLNKNREKRKLKIPNRKVYIDILEQDYIYELDIKNKKVIKKLNNQSLGNNYEIFKMNYSMLIGLMTRHFTWTNIEEDINYYRKPNTYDENLHFLMNFFSI